MEDRDNEQLSEWRELALMVEKIGRELEVFTGYAAQHMKRAANAVDSNGIMAGGVLEAKAALNAMLKAFKESVSVRAHVTRPRPHLCCAHDRPVAPALPWGAGHASAWHSAAGTVQAQSCVDGAVLCGMAPVADAEAGLEQWLTPVCAHRVQELRDVERVWGDDEKKADLLRDWVSAMKTDVGGVKKMHRLEAAVASLEVCRVAGWMRSMCISSHLVAAWQARLAPGSVWSPAHPGVTPLCTAPAGRPGGERRQHEEAGEEDGGHDARA